MLCSAFNDFSSNLAHERNHFLAFNWKKHTNIFCISLVYIHRRNDQVSVSASSSNLNITDTSLHIKAGKVLFALLNCGKDDDSRRWFEPYNFELFVP